MNQNQILFLLTALSIPAMDFILAAWMDCRDAIKRARIDNPNADVMAAATCSFCDERLTITNQYYMGGWADEYSHATCRDQINARAKELGIIAGRTDQPSVFSNGWKTIPPSSLPNDQREGPPDSGAPQHQKGK